MPFDAWHNAHPPLPHCMRGVVRFSWWLGLISLGGSSNTSRWHKPRQAHPWQSCRKNCPSFHFEPVTVCCYGCLARRSKIDVPLPLGRQFGQLWAMRRSSSSAHFASHPQTVSRSRGPQGSVQHDGAGRCGLPIFCHQNSTIITKETNQM